MYPEHGHEDIGLDLQLLEELGLLATEAQKDYIEELLYDADAELWEYTNTPLEELSKEEASSIIDELKGDLGYD